MPAISSALTRRNLLTTSAVGGAAVAALLVAPGVAQLAAAVDRRAIRPFSIRVPDATLADMLQRIAMARWPDYEGVVDPSRLTKIQHLVRYWGDGYDWRKAEAKLNALPQFITRIDGLDIQFAHVRSRHSTALPLIMTQGWPGSIFGLMKVVGPLTDPTAYGGRAEDAFHLVLPARPGHGFSAKPPAADWTPDRVARVWSELMQRLGYARNVSRHDDLSLGYSPVTRPQALGYSLADSPAGLAAWMYDRLGPRSFNDDEMLDEISFAWLTGAASSLLHSGKAGRNDHSTAWERPNLFVRGLRAAFRPLRG
jgi:hypothetical protein